MSTHKDIKKLGRASFGGYEQSRSADRIITGASSSLSRACAKVSLGEQEFPELGATGSPSKLNSAKATREVATRPFSRVQTEDIMPSTSATPSRNATSSRKIHNRAQGDDELLCAVDKEDNWSRRSSTKGNRRGSARTQAGDGYREARSVGSQDRIYYLGRLLTSILRHRAVELKLQIRDDGFLAVNDLLKLGIKTMAGLPLSVYTVDDVLQAVKHDNKQRFSVLTEGDVLLIRANQGHSIKKIESDKLLKPILSPDEIPVCVHGTLMSNLSSILKTGLKKMGRNHVHFASGLPREDGVISGMRHTSEVLIYLDVNKALQDGMLLYMSDNGVILTEGFDGVVPPEYFAQIAKWSKGRITPLPVNEHVKHAP